MWRAIWLSGIALFFLGALAPSDLTAESHFTKDDTLVYAVIGFIVSIAWVLFICSVESFFDGFRRAKRRWCRPSLTISPFVPRKPLQFWYFGALACMSAGLGESARIALLSQGTWQGVWLYWAIGVGLYIGCRLSLTFFSSRFIDGGTCHENK